MLVLLGQAEKTGLAGTLVELLGREIAKINKAKQISHIVWPLGLLLDWV